MVTKFVPLPADSGGRQRSLAMATRLAQEAEVVLCAHDDGRSDIDGLAGLGIEVRSTPWPPHVLDMARGLARARSATAGRFCTPRLRGLVRHALVSEPADVLVVSYSQLAPVAEGLPAGLRVLDLHNIESALLSSYASTRRGWKGQAIQAEAAAVRRLERRALAGFDVVSVVSTVDRTRLPGSTGEVLVCPNGLEPEPAPEPADQPVAAFVATMGWAPNTDAALWLGRRIWPLVLRAHPEARLLLVGRDPPAEVRALHGGSIDVTGTVTDVRPYLAATRVALAPLRSGGGTRLKILEALGAGRPTVATTLGGEGLEDLVGHGLVLADGEEPFAAATARLLADAPAATALGAAGRAAVTARYGWDHTLAPLLGRIGGDA